jgi:hypothetical protein
MTEEEWRACEDPVPMLEFLCEKASDRKLTLVVVETCRLWGRSWATLDVAERYAEGRATGAELAAAWSRDDAQEATYYRHVTADLVDRERALLRAVVAPRAELAAGVAGVLGGMAQPAAAVRLIRELFGPCPSNAFSPEWRTDTAVTLARQIDDSRDFSAMPILADALQDADCANEDILNHCRGSGPHVRGCWVVDLVLGKK